MSGTKLLNRLRNVLAENVDREIKAKQIAQAIRDEGAYRWVGIHDVDIEGGLVTNIARSGPSAPAYPIFPVAKGITSRAIAGGKTINVGDVTSDACYLTALDSTRSEIIVPVLDKNGVRVIGTIDVESERLNAFDSEAQALFEECARLLANFWSGGE